MELIGQQERLYLTGYYKIIKELAGASQTAVFSWLAEKFRLQVQRTDETLEYDGTNWTTGGALELAVDSNGVSGNFKQLV